MFSLPSSVEDELQKFLKLFVPNVILLKNKIKLSILSVKVKHVKDELQKPTLDVKVEQVKQGNGYVKIGLAIKKLNHVLVVKIKQIKKGNESMQEKGDVRIKVINKFYN